MSIALQYEARCVECKRKMKAGTEVSFSKESSGLVFWHSPDCPEPRKLQPPSQPDARERFDLRECTGGCNWAFERGTAPAVCSCGAEWAWTGDDGWRAAA